MTIGFDHLALKEIARRWGKITDEPYWAMMSALLRSFWMGELEREGESIVFIEDAPPNVRDASELGQSRSGDYVYSSPFPNAVMKIGEDGRRTLTADRVHHPVDRYAAARFLGPEPAGDNPPEGFARIPYGDWPKSECERFDEWRIGRDDFAGWYSHAQIWPKPPLGQFWEIELERSNAGDSSIRDSSPQIGSLPSRSKQTPEPILNEHNRRKAFLEWAKRKYGHELREMLYIGRDKLKEHGRGYVASNINEEDARWLRRQLPEDLKEAARKGGARYHKAKQSA